ncbi:MAG: iron-sulfur cluster assembly protein [Chloroflexota bacterium]
MTDNSETSNKVTWQAESTHPDLVEPFREKMREVVDPEIGLNIIELGLLRDVRIADESAEIKMILTTPFCPYGPAMLEMTRQKAEQALNRPVTVELGMEMWDFSMMEEGAGADWGLW